MAESIEVAKDWFLTEEEDEEGDRLHAEACALQSLAKEAKHAGAAPLDVELLEARAHKAKEDEIDFIFSHLFDGEGNLIYSKLTETDAAGNSVDMWKQTRELTTEDRIKIFESWADS